MSWSAGVWLKYRRKAGKNKKEAFHNPDNNRIQVEIQISL